MSEHWGLFNIASFKASFSKYLLEGVWSWYALYTDKHHLFVIQIYIYTYMYSYIYTYFLCYGVLIGDIIFPFFYTAELSFVST